MLPSAPGSAHKPQAPNRLHPAGSQIPHPRQGTRRRTPPSTSASDPSSDLGHTKEPDIYFFKASVLI